VDSVQLNTGEDDITKFSVITQFNGMPQLDYWEGEECNRIDGSEPSMFSPHLLQDRSTVNVFLQVLCRHVANRGKQLASGSTGGSGPYLYSVPR